MDYEKDASLPNLIRNRLQEVVEEGRTEDAVYRLLYYMTSYYDMKILEKFCDFLVEFQAPIAARTDQKRN